jgi:hypothetical protein
MRIMPLFVLLLIVGLAITGCTQQKAATEDTTKTTTDNTVVQGDVVAEIDTSLIAEDNTDTSIGEMV